jgi:hypothetical protein
MLNDIYNELVNLGKKLNSDEQTAIGNIKSWVSSFIKNTLKVSERTERRYRSGCNRIQQLLKNGVTYQQLVKAGCTPTTFYADMSEYKLFLAQLPINIKSDNIRSSSLSNFTNISTPKAIIKSNQEASLSGQNFESHTTVISDDDIVVDTITVQGKDWIIFFKNTLVYL